MQCILYHQQIYRVQLHYFVCLWWKRCDAVMVLSEACGCFYGLQARTDTVQTIEEKWTRFT